MPRWLRPPARARVEDCTTSMTIPASLVGRSALEVNLIQPTFVKGRVTHLKRKRERSNQFPVRPFEQGAELLSNVGFPYLVILSASCCRSAHRSCDLRYVPMRPSTHQCLHPVSKSTDPQSVPIRACVRAISSVSRPVPTQTNSMSTTYKWFPIDPADEIKEGINPSAGSW